MAQTIHYFEYSGGPPSATNLSSMAAAAVSAADTAFAGTMTANQGMTECEITDLSGPSYAQGSGGTPWVGTVSDERCSPGTAVLVNHTVGRRYRGGKPRSYLPLGTAGDITTAGLWSSASLSVFAGAWGSWVAAVKASGSGCTVTQIVNVSYYDGFTVVTSPTTGRARNVPKLRVGGPVVDVVNSHTVPANIASQRRRNRNA
jgi:hypothetical protein